MGYKLSAKTSRAPGRAWVGVCSILGRSRSLQVLSANSGNLHPARNKRRRLVTPGLIITAYGSLGHLSVEANGR